ncbi:MAG TPA: putative lipid II flippase FtsW [Verrucomicrobiota bacterium]|nr:putative lipid II flippase FtsW [Verrucomicrobiota bacterium]
MKTAVTTLMFCVAALLVLGLVMLYSSTMNDPTRTTGQFVGMQLLISQLIWCSLGLGACVVAAWMDYRWLHKYAWGLFAIAVVLLVAVLVLPEPWGKPIKGARRWINLPLGNVQPSEFAKLVLIIVMAWYCERYQRRMRNWTRGVLVPGGIMAVILGLIFIEPDRGTTILLAAVGGILLLLAGVQWRFFIPPALLALAGLIFSIWQDPMRMKRIFSWLYLEENRDGVGYQAYQAMIALGAGGWSGLGLGNGRQKRGFVPEHHTDFIFSIIGEELGLMATLAVVLAFVLIFICGLYIASRARDPFGKMLAAGLSFLIGLQAFINIGVVTSTLPNKGLALPFISYGGSSMLTMLTGVGLLLSVARQARAPEIRPTNPFAAAEFPEAQTL